ncbi:cytochrome P450 [Mycena vulgaris]|nr:cytochrome P450 [Mycena vulgaris]
MDSMPLQSMFAVFSGMLLVVLSFVYLRGRRSKYMLPPGPAPLPLVGNLFSMPSHSEWVTYAKWSKEYNSEILHINVLGVPIVVISSVEMASDLFDKRSAIYSDRPRSTMLNELVGGDFIFTFMKYGNTWRRHRRLFHQEFQPIAVRRFRGQERAHAHLLLHNMLDHPEMFAQHLKHVMGANIMSIAYGLDCMPSNDPYIDAAETALGALRMAAAPGKFLVDIIPVLKYIPGWVPGAGFKRTAAEWKRLVQEMVDRPFEAAKRAVNDGVGRASFVTNELRALDENADNSAEERDIKDVAGTMYVAGADTSRVTLLFFLLAMMENPDIAKRAQHEIDSVVKPGHLPDFEDYDAMPYVTALLKELLRWRPAAPMGVPHFLSVEDVYQGYRIPAGSVVIANAWAMLHDETVYPEPEVFNPERFLCNGNLDLNIRGPDAGFGFGRRECPGQSMAFDTLWIMVASMLAVFDITKPLGADGQPIEPPVGFISDIGMAPLPFKCSITPRSKEAVELIRAAEAA